MKYTERDIFEFHEKTVHVRTNNGAEFSGMCWAYGKIQAEVEDGLPDAYLDIGPGWVVLACEIESIEEID